MTRLPDWEPRLEGVLQLWSSSAHGWHATCGDFAADVVRAIDGRDLRPLIGLPVRSARETVELLRRANARTMSDAVSSVLGQPVGPRSCCRGDVVEATGDMALGVCLGTHAAFLENHGIILLPMAVVARGWRL